MMSDWYCFKDKVKMLDSDLILTYMRYKQHVPGMKCPECGAEYLTESVVMNIVQEAEDAIEGK
jgi:hypothetical protein